MYLGGIRQRMSYDIKKARGQGIKGITTPWRQDYNTNKVQKADDIYKLKWS